jgi:hypothetical protein
MRERKREQLGRATHKGGGVVGPGRAQEAAPGGRDHVRRLHRLGPGPLGPSCRAPSPTALGSRGGPGRAIGTDRRTAGRRGGRTDGRTEGRDRARARTERRERARNEIRGESRAGKSNFARFAWRARCCAYAARHDARRKRPAIASPTALGWQRRLVLCRRPGSAPPGT